MRHGLRFGACAVAGVVGLALVSACGATSGAAGSGAATTASGKATLPTADPTSTVFTSAEQMRFPDDAYQPSATQIAEIQYLNLRLTQQCMQSMGFDYLPTLSTAMIAQNAKIEGEFKSRLYGISDADAAATYGYHLPTWTSGSTSGQMMLSQVPADERAVLEGQGAKTYDGKAVPAGGCLGQAGALLSQAGVHSAGGQPGGGQSDAGSGGGSQAADALPQSVEVSAFEDAQADPRVVAVVAKWSSCMAASGYHYSTPLSALGDKRWLTSAPAGRTEIQTAERDIACKLQSHLLDVEYSVQSGYEEAAIAKNAQTMSVAESQLSAEASGLNRLMKQYGE